MTAHPDPTTCGHTKVGPTGILWICTAPPGPLNPPWITRHVHYYVNQHPTLDTQEQ